MIKGLLIITFAVGIFGAGTAPTIKDHLPHSIELTTGPIIFKASTTGFTTFASSRSELSLSVHSKSLRLIKINF